MDKIYINNKTPKNVFLPKMSPCQKDFDTKYYKKGICPLAVLVGIKHSHYQIGALRDF